MIIVDKTLTSLDDLLGIMMKQVERMKVESVDKCYLKIWRFFEENNNPEAVRNAPVALGEKFEFKRAEAYLGLLLYRKYYAENSLPEELEAIKGGDNLVANGISSQFITGISADIHYDMFVAFGKSAGGLVKAIVVTKAYELETLLKKSEKIISVLYSGIHLKSNKIGKAETISLAPSGKKNRSELLKWILRSHSEPLTLFKKEFLTSGPSGSLFMNPFGAATHRPKIASLSLQSVQSKLQEKEYLNDNIDLKELETLEIRDTTRNEIALEYYAEKASEVCENVYVGGDSVARNNKLMVEIGITHIFNCSGNVCENYFPDDFEYIKYFIKDSSGTNIESLFYRVCLKVYNILRQGGKVLFHCVQGVSRSVSLCISYMLFKENISYEQALNRCKEVRMICNPNIGFQVQLIWWAKRLHCSYESLAVDPRVFVVCSYDQDQPSLIVAKLLLESMNEKGIFDRRGVYIIHNTQYYFIWIGSLIYKQNHSIYYRTALEHCELLKTYEKCKNFVEVSEGNESEEFWGMFTGKPIVGVDDKGEEMFIELELDEDIEYEQIFVADDESVNNSAMKIEGGSRISNKSNSGKNSVIRDMEDASLYSRNSGSRVSKREDKGSEDIDNGTINKESSKEIEAVFVQKEVEKMEHYSEFEEDEESDKKSKDRSRSELSSKGSRKESFSKEIVENGEENREFVEKKKGENDSSSNKSIESVKKNEIQLKEGVKEEKLSEDIVDLEDQINEENNYQGKDESVIDVIESNHTIQADLVEPLNREDDYKVILFIYPGLKGQPIFNESALSDSDCLCLCTLTKSYVWIGKNFEKSSDDINSYALAITKAFYADAEIEIITLHAGEESQEFLNYFC